MPSRTALRRMTTPIALACVLIAVLSLTVRVAALTLGLAAEVCERLAVAGELATAAVAAPAYRTTYTRGGKR